jgi:hypothetical protein
MGLLNYEITTSTQQGALPSTPIIKVINSGATQLRNNYFNTTRCTSLNSNRYQTGEISVVGNTSKIFNRPPKSR